MVEHLNAERISALLDEPWSDKGGQGHLETCTDCQAEFERLSRIRMALSALPDEEPPSGQWTAIEAALDASESDRAGVVPIGRRMARRLLVPGPLQAAAGLLLFAGGVFAGLQLTGGGAPGSPADVPAVVSSGDDRALLDGLNQMESIRAPLRQVGIGGLGPASGDAVFPGTRNPIETAQSLVRLEGSIQALRDRLEESPDDVVASAYLLDLVELRDRLTEELGRASGSRTW